MTNKQRLASLDLIETYINGLANRLATIQVYLTPGIVDGAETKAAIKTEAERMTYEVWTEITKLRASFAQSVK